MRAKRGLNGKYIERCGDCRLCDRSQLGLNAKLPGSGIWIPGENCPLPDWTASDVAGDPGPVPESTVTVGSTEPGADVDGLKARILELEADRREWKEAAERRLALLCGNPDKIDELQSRVRQLEDTLIYAAERERERAERIRELEAENAKLRAEAERMKDQARENNGRIRNPDLPNCLMCKNSVDGCGNCGWTEPPESVITRLREKVGRIQELEAENAKLQAGFDRATTLAANALNYSRELAEKPVKPEPAAEWPEAEATLISNHEDWWILRPPKGKGYFTRAQAEAMAELLNSGYSSEGVEAKPEPAPAAEWPEVCSCPSGSPGAWIVGSYMSLTRKQTHAMAELINNHSAKGAKLAEPADKCPRVRPIRTTYSRDDCFRIEATKGHLTRAQAEAMADMLNNRAKWEALREAAWKLIGTSQDLRVFGGKISGSNAYRQEEKVRAALAVLGMKS